MKRSLGRKAQINVRKLNCYVLTITDVFFNQKRINVWEHTVKIAPHVESITFLTLENRSDTLETYE